MHHLLKSLAAFFIVLFVGSCSGSGSSTDSAESAVDTPPVAAGDAVVVDDDSVNPVDSETGQNVADPLIQNSTRVTFDIQVPAYQSDMLQLSLMWREREISAIWVGDEFWSAADDFPTDTEERLTVTFFDRNGEITLASFETDFRTGTNASESLQITVCLLYTSPSPRDRTRSRMPSSA